MTPTARELDPLIADVRALVTKANAEAAKISDATLRNTQQGALRMVAGNIETWAVKQRAEVLAGTRLYERWRKDGLERLATMMQFVRDAGDVFARWSRASLAVGEVALSIDGAVRSIGDKVDALQKDVAALKIRRARFEKERATWKKLGPTGEVQSLLFGAKASAALTSYDQLLKLTEGLGTVVSLVRGGRAKLESDGSGDFRAVATTQLGTTTLGAVPLVAGLGAGAVIATVAICGTLAASVWAFFRHLDEATSSDLQKRKLELVSQGKGSEVLALQELQNKNDEDKGDAGFGGLTSAVKVLGGIVLAGGLAYIGKQIFDAVRADRRRAA